MKVVSANRYRVFNTVILPNIFKSIGILAGVIFFAAVLDVLSFRYSIFYWTCASTIVVLMIFWSTKRVKIPAVIVILTGVVLATSPLDFRIMSGEPGIHLFKISYGNATRPGTFGYGCIVGNNPPTMVLVLSLDD